MAEVVELQKLKLAELKQECALRGLEVKGNKADLIARLQAYIDEHEDDVNEEEVLEEFTEEAAAAETEPQEETAPLNTEASKKVVKITLSDSGNETAEKGGAFNLPPSLESKKAARASRFGIPVTSPLSKGTSAISKTNVDVEVLKKRAERFGMNVSSVSKKAEEDEKLKKRKERFGIVTSAASVGVDDTEVKKRKRSERFGIA